ncbi:MAG: NADH:ubiquinone reductase (Na(+)-transporting) subunit C [Saprospiraceae bacterium]|nr:NADH:ubiquinone reductase (Na(+)-transporting) subunit C [Saprospiraceae bacterium]
MHSTRYIITFVAVLTMVVALVLSLLATGLKPIHDRNEAIYNKKAILSAINAYLDEKPANMSAAQVQKIFDDQIQQEVVDMKGNVIEGLKAEDIDMAKEKKKPLAEQRLPVYIYNSPEGKVYIVSVRGSGLWDEIWGSIALKNDFNTIVGATFDHKGETPGLGAEIKDNPKFPEQFIGKTINDESGNYVSIDVVKGGIKEMAHQVDAISGATITSKGVAEMLDRGLEYYQPFFENQKK